ncbi:MAG: tRNA (adenosine(37)-N6)-threonylcarbamoyltransferase complex dimerization subunit type 1 TsaB [Gammaproteobacteria bacterium]|nr:tRNA (adenosine(37)-N6)-threonylcarbamoyltransferase complex dimerization subunit type 1 TsaB [Gammaproteobacteria bacterium]
MSSPTILAIETATSACSAALRHNDQVWKAFEVGNNVHSKLLLQMVSGLFAEANIDAQTLDAVAVGQGPGSFTGLRIGVGVGQGIAYGAACPMVGISSLDVLARSVSTQFQDNQQSVIAAIDARMGEIYWAEYSIEGQTLHRVSDLLVTPPEDLKASSNNALLVGNAWAEYWDSLDANQFDKSRVLSESKYPKATDLLELAGVAFASGQTCSAADFAPIYVRNDVAKKSTKPLPGRRI